METNISWIHDLVIASYVENGKLTTEVSKRTLQAEIAVKASKHACFIA